ncbi:MAG: hypothetical protein K6C94_02245 [Candidatus Gastranaerophilales bacterium]|nr:hypothetical protein [Candidatus Gastranaerophilales bacterium]
MNRVKTFVAATNLDEHTAVKFTTGGKVTKATSATDSVIGVTEFAAATGKAVDVVLFGIGHVQVDGSCDYGDLLVATTGGKATVFDAETAEGTVTVIGRTLEAASASAYINTVINPVPLIIPAAAEAEETTTNAESDTTT